MKKLTTILILLFVLSVSVFADDGTINSGGKSCSPGQVCFTGDGQTPAGGKTENTIYQDIFDFLKSIFK